MIDCDGPQGHAGGRSNGLLRQGAQRIVFRTGEIGRGQRRGQRGYIPGVEQGDAGSGASRQQRPPTADSGSNRMLATTLPGVRKACGASAVIRAPAQVIQSPSWSV